MRSDKDILRFFEGKFLGYRSYWVFEGCNLGLLGIDVSSSYLIILIDMYDIGVGYKDDVVEFRRVCDKV